MKLSPVYFVSSDDPFQQRLLIDDLRTAIFPNGPTGLNDDSVDAKEKSSAEILDLANTLPMLGSQRLLQVRNFSTIKEADEKKWLDYFENPAPQTVLVVLVSKVDKRKKIYKVLAKKGWLHLTTPPKPRDLPEWVNRIAERYQITIAPTAKRALIDAIGPDLSTMSQEIEKLALYIHPERKITDQAVRELVMRTAGENIFAWSDHIVEGRLGKALDTLHYLFETGTPPLIMLGMLARHIRILLKARHALENRTPTGQLASVLGVPPFTVSRYMEQVRTLSLSQLRRSLEELQELDQSLKSTGLPPKILIENSLRSICRHTTTAA